METESVKYCTFEAAGRLFGVPLIDIKEITAETNCTCIPHAPECVRGYVNIRGNIILGLDLKRILALPANQEDSSKRMVIFKSTVGPAFGLLVDEIGEIVSVSSQDITSDTTSIGSELQGLSGLVQNICRLPNQLLVVLNPRKFLPIIEKELIQPSRYSL